MMNKEQFFSVIRCSVQDLLDEKGIEAELIIKEVVKSNDQVLTGLHVKGEENQPAPCIYLDELYEQFRKGYPVFHMANEIANAMAEAMNMDLDLQPYNEYETAKNFLTLRLVGIDENQQWLADKVWEPLGDLAKVCYLDLGEREQGRLVSAVTEGHLELWDVTGEQVMQDALVSLKKKRTIIKSLHSMIQEQVPDMQKNEKEVPEKNPFFVITNEEKQYGAAMIAIPEVLEALSVGFSGDFYIIPSSVHEVLIIPADAGMNAKVLTQMLHDVNEQEVDAREKLSDKVQYYSREKKKVINALKKEEALQE